MGAVGGNDDRLTAPLVPGHVGGEAWITTGMADDPAVLRVILDRQTETVAGGDSSMQWRLSQGRGHRTEWLLSLNQISCLETGAGRYVMLLEQSGPAKQVRYGRVQSTNGGERPRPGWFLHRPAGCIPNEQRLAVVAADRRSQFFCREARAGQAEWLQDLFPYELTVVLAADSGDDLTKQGVAEVRVLKVRSGCEHKPQPFFCPALQLFPADGLLAVPPRIICRQATGHSEQVTQPEFRPVRLRDRVQFRQMRPDGVIETQSTRTAQDQNCQGSEALRKRSYPEWRVQAVAICSPGVLINEFALAADGNDAAGTEAGVGMGAEDRKSTRLNSSHVAISYAVFCLKKKQRAEIIHCC